MGSAAAAAAAQKLSMNKKEESLCYWNK